MSGDPGDHFGERNIPPPESLPGERISEDQPPDAKDHPPLPADDAPPHQQPHKRRYVRLQPHRGNTVLGLGISGVVMALVGGMMAFSLYFCCPLWLLPLASLGLSIPAWVMGQQDLAAMRAGTMDPSGKDLTTIGMIGGIVGASVIAAGLLVIALIFVFYAVFFGFAAASSQF